MLRRSLTSYISFQRPGMREMIQRYPARVIRNVAGMASAHKSTRRVSALPLIASSTPRAAELCPSPYPAVMINMRGSLPCSMGKHIPYSFQSERTSFPTNRAAGRRTTAHRRGIT